MKTVAEKIEAIKDALKYVPNIKIHTFIWLQIEGRITISSTEFDMSSPIEVFIFRDGRIKVDKGDLSSALCEMVEKSIQSLIDNGYEGFEDEIVENDTEDYEYFANQL